MVHMINAHDAYDQFDRIHSYVVKLPPGDFRDGVLFHPHGFKRKLKNELNRAKRFGNFFGGLTKR